MIYFVRHGLSEANAKKIFAGQRDDSVLIDKGREQAKETAKKIKEDGIKIHKIVSSPSKRTHETAKIIAEELGLNISDIVLDKRITEYDMGSISGTPWGIITSKILIGAENAEDPIGFHDRVHSCVKELSQSSENILLVSHAGVGRMLEIIKMNGDKKLFYDLPPYPNASIIEIDWIS
ncbi:MAG: histidine phosphatase family protein [Candidatus Nomurabacteria bacterium]|nr:histidine phosphatase family protein [Candidatus Nomurabacteria bacterium]